MAFRNRASMNDQRGASAIGRQPLNLTFTGTAHTANGVAGVGLNYQMSPHDHVIIAISAVADASAIITLPSKAEAYGIYVIYAPTAATAGDVSVYDKETGAEWTTEGDLDADADTLVAICTGQTWCALHSPA